MLNILKNHLVKIVMKKEVQLYKDITESEDVPNELYETSLKYVQECNISDLFKIIKIDNLRLESNKLTKQLSTFKLCGK